MGFGEQISGARAIVQATWQSSGRSVKVAFAAAGVAASLRWVAGAQPEWTERLYSRGFYPWVQRVQSESCRLSPWSVGEAVLAALVAVVLAQATLLARALAHRAPDRLERSLRQLLRLAALASAIWVVYLFAWAFHYARLPYAHGTGLDLRTADAAELEDATRDWMRRAGELRARLREGSDGVVELDGDFERLSSRVAQAYERAAGEDARLAGPRPVLREALVSPLMTAAGISGIYWPFTGEPHVNAQPPAPQRLFSALHEVAHERGFAREDEANYIACRVGAASGDQELAYAASLMAFLHLHRSLREADPARGARIAAERHEGLRRDSAAISEFWRPPTRLARSLREVSTTVNDAYLKAQGQRQGVRSYGRMVDLLLAERRARVDAVREGARW